MYDTFDIAQDSRANVDLLDCAAGGIDHGHIPDSNLVLQQQKDAADDVPHEALSAKAHRESHDTCSGE